MITRVSCFPSPCRHRVSLPLIFFMKTNTRLFRIRMSVAAIALLFVVCPVPAGAGAGAGATGDSASASSAACTVGTLAALQSRIAQAKPGDTIILKNGVYTTSEPVTIMHSGSATQPITITAETVGGVEIRGTHGFTARAGAAHVVISGFKLTHASGGNTIAVGAHHIRITRCTFASSGKGCYLGVRGDDCEVDHCEFRDKDRLGNMIDVAGEKGQVARRLHIHHNYFHNFKKSRVQGEGNGLETIRFGLSHLGMSTGGGIVEHNLFVRCEGENELISNKSCGNTYRHNTFLDSRGAQLTLRHGNDCIVEKNYFHNTGGLRIFGDRHKVRENFLGQNTTGIHIGNGAGEVADGAEPTTHDRPDHNEITGNILVDNKVSYLMSARKNGLGATRTTFSGNIIVGGGAAVKIDGPYTNPVWTANTVWKTAAPGNLPENAFNQTDPGALTPATLGLRVLTPADVGPSAP